jgi:hypothetical protein
MASILARTRKEGASAVGDGISLASDSARRPGDVSERHWRPDVGGNLQGGAVPGLNTVDSLTPTLFHQAWWLDIATGGRYDVVETRLGGRVVGRMPFITEKRLGFRLSLMPPLTHVMGPAIDEGEGTANARFLQRLGVTRDLIAKLPAISYFRQKMHRGISDVIAYQMEKFETSVQFTHEIAPLPAEEIWRGMRDKTRNMVRKAERHFEVGTMDDPDRFARFYIDNLASRMKADKINVPVCRSLITECLARDSGQIYVARGADGAIVAAVFCAWDTNSAYYLMTTRAMSSGNSAVTLLLWRAIQDATARGLTFDFDGVASAGSVLFYAGFGGTLRTRYVVSRVAKGFGALNSLRLLTLGNRSAFN